MSFTTTARITTDRRELTEGKSARAGYSINLLNKNLNQKYLRKNLQVKSTMCQLMSGSAK